MRIANRGVFRPILEIQELRDATRAEEEDVHREIAGDRKIDQSRHAFEEEEGRGTYRRDALQFGRYDIFQGRGRLYPGNREFMARCECHVGIYLRRGAGFVGHEAGAGQEGLQGGAFNIRVCFTLSIVEVTSILD